MATLPAHVWAKILLAVDGCDAASLACTCVDARNAYRHETNLTRAVRVNRAGMVLEPASGAFDVTVAPGDDVEAAVASCPRDGSVLLLPGVHRGPVTLRANDVHVFGRGLAVLESTLVVRSQRGTTIDGLRFREPDDERLDHHVVIEAGSCARVQECDVSTVGRPPTDAAIINHALLLVREGANPVIVRCSFTDGAHSGGVVFEGSATSGRLVQCIIARNQGFGVMVQHGASPLVRSCMIQGNRLMGVNVIHGATPRLFYNTISHNAHGGVSIYDAAEPNLVGNTIHSHAVDSAADPVLRPAIGVGVFVAKWPKKYMETPLMSHANIRDNTFANNEAGDVVCRLT